MADFDSGSSSSEDSNEEELRPMCAFGSDCYRKNPKHFVEFRHPFEAKPKPKPRRKVKEVKVSAVKRKAPSSEVSKRVKKLKTGEDGKVPSAKPIW